MLDAEDKESDVETEQGHRNRSTPGDHLPICISKDEESWEQQDEDAASTYDIVAPIRPKSLESVCFWPSTIDAHFCRTVYSEKTKNAVWGLSLKEENAAHFFKIARSHIYDDARE